ncbi:MAG: isoprenylcysteine carboxylmethyltransferase family protein [Candidatus Dormibacteraeota bacterium]|nr:isoprenylcysteine carboxylmethyltransferase family protein [Candidatus Dormibacteraeota bacterium]
MIQAIGATIAVGWLAFWVFWFAAAATAKRSRLGTYSSVSILLRLGIFVLVFVLIRVKAFGALIPSPAVQALGLVLWVLGLAFAVWARLYIGRNWGMPMTERVDPELVTTGPYRSVRHPIYTGVIVALIGTSLAVGLYWLIIAAAVAAYFIYSATIEERNLAREFPSSYPAYKRSTKMLIPLLF